MSINFSAIEERENTSNNSGAFLHPIITVFGVGGAGNNAVNNMINLNLEGVRFVAGNTDMQALKTCLAPTKVQLGKTITGGLGAGSHPEVGVRAAEEAEEEIREAIKDSNMLFITAGMGGGTGTGASSIIAKIAREMNILTVGVVTKPFDFEGSQKANIAEKGIEELLKYVDTLIVISNQMLFKLIDKDTSLQDSFRIVDQAMVACIKSMADLMLSPGVINLDFNDVKFMIGDMGRALFSVSEAEGENRSQIVSEDIVKNPLIEDVELKGASKVLVNIAGSSNITLHEIDDIVTKIKSQLSEDAIINFGTVLDEELGSKIKVSLVATGIKVESNKQLEQLRHGLPAHHYSFEENGENRKYSGTLDKQNTTKDINITEKITRKTRYSNNELDGSNKDTLPYLGIKNELPQKQVRVKSKKTTSLSGLKKESTPQQQPRVEEEEPKQSKPQKQNYAGSKKGFFDTNDSDSLFSKISSSNKDSSSSKGSVSFKDSLDSFTSAKPKPQRQSMSSDISHKDVFFDLPNFFKIKK